MKFLKYQLYKIILYVSTLTILSLMGYFWGISTSILSSISSLITFIFIIILQKTWLEDYKSELDKKLETHKAKLSGYTLVTKLQFDLEFKIYTEVYELGQLHFKAIIAIFQRMTLDKRDDFDSVIEKYNTSYNAFMSSFLKNKPFYQQKIFNKILKIFDLSDQVCIEYFEFEAKQKKSGAVMIISKNIERELDELSELIRERIENMKIVE